MGLSAFNAMRARLAKQQAEEVKTESTIKVTEVAENKEVEKPIEATEEVKVETVETKPKKKTDAEKLKKE